MQTINKILFISAVLFCFNILTFVISYERERKIKVDKALETLDIEVLTKYQNFIWNTSNSYPKEKLLESCSIKYFAYCVDLDPVKKEVQEFENLGTCSKYENNQENMCKAVINSKSS